MSLRDAKTATPKAVQELAEKNLELAAENERLEAENDSLRVSAHNYTVAAKENERLQADLFRERANAARLRDALRFYGGNTDEGGLAFMPAAGGGYLATESKPGECARAALAETSRP